MPQPHNYHSLPPDVNLTNHGNGNFILSQPLIDLLIQARNGYDWPEGTGTATSQQIIINLEKTVSYCLTELNSVSAHIIVTCVSHWAGNNANSHRQIMGASPDLQQQMENAIATFTTPGQESAGIDALSALPGVSLVIASKIFRFCCPTQGAAVDRHASYFFNSLQVIGNGLATNFVREWTNGHHATSRLATYTDNYYNRNRTEYFDTYLPLLSCIATAMNAVNAPYTCAAQNIPVNWRAADVEMAAYFWWANNGAR